MFRLLLLVIVLAAAAWGAATLAQVTGGVTLTWQDWQIDTSLGVFIGAVLVVVLILAVVLHLLMTLRRAPRALGRGRRDRRNRLGYEALSRGLVAVAAGDGQNAQRQAWRASKLLNERPLTMLLSAQAAQLNGDEQRARQFFTAMREREETEFLGLRGLLAQAMRRQDWTEALALAERAYRLNPKSDWVVSTLYDLQKQAGLWADAEGTLKQRTSLQLLAASDAPRERAELLLRQSENLPPEAALATAKKAYRTDPGYPPAALRYARLLVGAGKHSRAVEVIERAWAACPDPELAEVYWQARQSHDALAKVKAAQRLAACNPESIESRIVVAVAALEAHLWGEARANLESVAGDNAPPRVCRLMAELEEAEHGDLARARMWLRRAAGEETSAPLATPAAGTTELAPMAEPIAEPART